MRAALLLLVLLAAWLPADAAAEQTAGIPTARTYVEDDVFGQWVYWGSFGTYDVNHCIKPNKKVYCHAESDGIEDGRTFRCGWTVRVVSHVHNGLVRLRIRSNQPVCWDYIEGSRA